MSRDVVKEKEIYNLRLRPVRQSLYVSRKVVFFQVRSRVLVSHAKRIATVYAVRCAE